MASLSRGKAIDNVTVRFRSAILPRFGFEGSKTAMLDIGMIAIGLGFFCRFHPLCVRLRVETAILEAERLGFTAIPRSLLRAVHFPYE
jgi:hypothetical protein